MIAQYNKEVHMKLKVLDFTIQSSNFSNLKPETHYACKIHYNQFYIESRQRLIDVQLIDG
jgi:hypothetical protein